jgi:hypothetical protein
MLNYDLTYCDFPTKYTFPNMDTNSNRLIEEELNYDINHLEQEANRLYLFMNNDQNNAFHTIIQTVLDNRKGFYFVSGHGGTGKHIYGIQLSTILEPLKK